MPTLVKGLSVDVLPDGDLQVEGLGRVPNPLKSLELTPDLGQLWLALWAEDQHFKPNSARIRGILLNNLNLSVAQVIQAITQGG